MALMTKYRIPSIDYEEGWLEHERDVFAKDWNNEQDPIYDDWQERCKDKPIRVRVENGKFVPPEPLNIPEGTLLLVTIVTPEEVEQDVGEPIQEARESKKSSELPSWPGDTKGTFSREDIYEDL